MTSLPNRSTVHKPRFTWFHGNSNPNCHDLSKSAEFRLSPNKHFPKHPDERIHVPRKSMASQSFSLIPERFENVGPWSHFDLSMLDERAMVHCRRVLIVLAFLMIMLCFPFSLIFCLRVIHQYERAVIFRLGRIIIQGPTGPGLIFIIPCLDTLIRVDLRIFTFNVPTQEVLTKDSVTVAVNAVVYYRIYDPVLSVVNVENANRSTSLLAQTTLRNALGTVDLRALLAEREQIAATMQETLDSATDNWGMKVERVEIKDVRLPVLLQRTMAAEAKATREARAQVISAMGEQNASRILKEAAKVISTCPVALQLRYLHTLSGISSGRHSTIIFPLPIDVMHSFQLSEQLSSAAASSSSAAAAAAVSRLKLLEFMKSDLKTAVTAPTPAVATRTKAETSSVSSPSLSPST